MKTSALQIESVKIQNVCEKVVERLPFVEIFKKKCRDGGVIPLFVNLEMPAQGGHDIVSGLVCCVSLSHTVW